MSPCSQWSRWRNSEKQSLHTSSQTTRAVGQEALIFTELNPNKPVTQRHEGNKI